MKCPHCQLDDAGSDAKHEFVDSRSNGDGLTGRKYKCSGCASEFTTKVREEVELPGRGVSTYALLSAAHARNMRAKYRESGTNAV
jgi:transposase-like protein